MKRILLVFLGTAAFCGMLWADPPSRVGRLSYTEGTVSYASAAGEKWQTAMLNYPLTAGNLLSTAAGSRAEIQIGSAAVQLAADTSVSFDALDDQTVQLRVDKGQVSVRLHDLGPGQGFQVDLQTASVSLSAPGLYRFRQTEAGDAAVVTRNGDAQVTGGQAAFHVRSGQSADIPASGPDAHRIAAAPPPDQWDAWVAERDSKAYEAASSRYVSRETDGVGDLDRSGSWQVVAGYGPVWYPTVVPAGWAPYTFGTWVWINPWGWTWVDNEPWGFAPFHYGRWALISGGWCWVPGPIAVHPVYAPALVRWVGGTPWHGVPPAAAHIAWTPLGPRQVYHPLYSVSAGYVRAVNGTFVASPRVAYRPAYVGRTAAGAPLPGRQPWPYDRPQPMYRGTAAPYRGTAAPYQHGYVAPYERRTAAPYEHGAAAPYAPRAAAPQYARPVYPRHVAGPQRGGANSQDWRRPGR